jgi:hypothetical protein
MSTAHDAPAAEAHDAHAEPFDGEPARTLSPGEPRTPVWLPILGLVIFVTAGIALLVGAGGPPAEPPAKQAENTAAAPAATRAPPAATPLPQPGAAASAPPEGTLRQLSPAQMELLKKRLEQAKQKKQGPQPGQAAPP